MMSEARLLRRLRYLSGRVCRDAESAACGLREYRALVEKFVDVED